MDTITCNKCFKAYPLSKYDLKDNGRLVRLCCKQCHSDRVYEAQNKRKLEKYPNIYSYCIKCKHIYNKKHQSCPNCKVVNITDCL
jgi:hypothetical protein